MEKLKKNIKNTHGFTLIEMMFGVLILGVTLNFLSGIISVYLFDNKIDNSANLISKIPLAVEARNAHDGFLFSLWDTNGNNAATDTTITWDQNSMDDLYKLYLTGWKNNSCGNTTKGWNPLNIGGDKNTGDETAMERASLVGCNTFSGVLPFRIKLSAALGKDATDAVSKFILYLDMSNSYFDEFDHPDNNIINYISLKEAFIEKLGKRNINGIQSISFGLANDLNDINDDTFYKDSECETQLLAKNNCDMIITIDFSGSTNGLFKRTNNQNFFTEDTTWGRSLAEGRQKCAFWEQDVTTNTWTGSLVDCGIRGGSGRVNVTAIMDKINTSELTITNEAELNHLCKVFEETNVANNNMLLKQKAAPNDTSPCGITKDGNIVQLISDNAHIGKLYTEDIVAKNIYAEQTTLYSDINGNILIKVLDSTHTKTTFTVDNNGNTFVDGSLDVTGITTLSDNVFADADLFVSKNATFYMDTNSTITMGDSTNGLTFSRETKNSKPNFKIKSSSVQFELLNKNNNGIEINNNNGNDEINLKANGGVIAKNGTTIHNSRSSLTGNDFNSSGNINSQPLKDLSETVSYDMARYLDDTSSPIQLVSIDKVEGVFMTITKPDCLSFTKNENYSSPDANPYKDMLSSLPSGESLARLVLTPTYFKTYNAAFGDNQLYAQHASHSSPTTWDVFLYLSGEGALGTGAREDAAGASLAQIYCDYNSINFSKKPL